jgi:branched-chain amino acid transport system substrate-binding protein
MVLAASRVRAAEPLEIPVMLSQSGAAAFLGKEQKTTLTILEHVVNTSGGIAGRPLHFAFYDDQSTPQVGLQIANDLIAHNAPVILGSSYTQVCAALVPRVKNGPVTYCFSPGIHPAAGGYVFASSVSTRDLVSVLFRFLRERGWTRVALIASTDQTGQDFERAFDASLAARENGGFAVVAREHFAPGDLSVGAQMARIKARAPQALFAWTVGTPFGTLLHGIDEAGLNVPVLSSNGNMIFDELTQYAAVIPNQLYFPGTTALVPGTIGPGPIRAKQAAFYRAFAAAGVRPDNPNNTAWDVAVVVIDAFRHLGPNATAEQIRDYIRGQHGWVGINGVYDFGDAEQRGIGASALVVYRYDGKAAAFLPQTRPGGGKRS